MQIRGNLINKIIDRSILKCVFWGLIAFRKIWRIVFPIPNDLNSSIKSILVVQIGTIGDAVLSIPLLQHFRKLNYKITVLASSANIAIFQMEKFETIRFELSEIIKNPFLLPRLMVNMKKSHFGTIVDMIPWMYFTGCISMLVRARGSRIVGFKTAGYDKRLAFDRFVSHSNNIHEYQNYFNLFNLIESIALDPLSLLSKADDDQISTKVDLSAMDTKLDFKIVNSKFIIIHPFAGGYRGYDREWEPEKYLAIVKHFSSQFHFVVTGAPQDLDRSLPFQKQKNISLACSKTNLWETMALIQRAELVLTVNTGVLHIAAWLGKNIVALNGPTNVSRWGPLKYTEGQKIHNFTSKAFCSPCLNLGFEYKCKKSFCMDMNVENVIKVIREFTSV